MFFVLLYSECVRTFNQLAYISTGLISPLPIMAPRHNANNVPMLALSGYIDVVSHNIKSQIQYNCNAVLKINWNIHIKIITSFDL